MADLGVIGRGLVLTDAARIGVLKVINLGGDHITDMVAFAGRNNSEGNLGMPCLELRYDNKFKLLWAVDAGYRTFSIYVKQVGNGSPRPRVTIKANPDIGVADDISESAGSSSDWIAIGPINVAVASDGVLEVLLEALYFASYDPCYWDDITVT